MLKTSLLFLKNNFRGYKSIFISIVIFIFIINIVSIFIIGMASGLNDQVIDNDNLNIFELYPDENQKGLTKTQVDSLSDIDGVSDAYYTEGISIECTNTDTNISDYNFSVFKLDYKYLKYYGLPETDSETYFYGNISANPDLKIGDNFRATKNENKNSNNITFQITDVVTIPENLTKLIPGDLSFTDPVTFDKLLKNCDCWYINEWDYSQRLEEGATIHLIVPDVTKQNDVADSIRDQYKNIKVSYVLESARKLPIYVDTFIKIGFVLLIILFIFYIISIRNNISHILNFRTNGIRLFNTLGVVPIKIVRYFYYEFMVVGFISWLTQFVLTIIAVIIAATLLNIDVYLTAIQTVLLENILLLFISIGMEGYFVIKRNVIKVLEFPDRS